MINNSTLMDDFQTTKGGNLLHFAIECSEKMEQVERTLCLDVLLQTSLKHKIDCCDNSGFFVVVIELLYSVYCDHCNPQQPFFSLSNSNYYHNYQLPPTP
jgi:hypothetical protein